MTDSTSLDRLRTQVEYPESWRPEPGDTLVGTAVAWSTFEKTDPATQETKECQILAGPRAASMPGLVFSTASSQSTSLPPSATSAPW